MARNLNDLTLDTMRQGERVTWDDPRARENVPTLSKNAFYRVWDLMLNIQPVAIDAERLGLEQDYFVGILDVGAEDTA